MKQVIRKGLRQIIVEEVPDPVLKPHHVLIRPRCTLISSGTEAAALHQQGVLHEVLDNPSHLRRVWNAIQVAGPVRALAEVRAKFSEYAVLGYAGAGVVAGRHPTVTDLEIGDRVAYGGEGTGHAETVLAGRNLVVKMPAGLSFESACFATLGSIAMNAVRTANIGLGDVVAVMGQGLVGQLIAQLARLQGGVVVALDLKPERVDAAKALGADHALPGGEEAPESIRAVSQGRGADCVIVAAGARSPTASCQALALCRDRGRLVIVGAVELSFPWEEMYRKEIQLFMSRAYGPGSYDPTYEEAGQDYPVAYVRWTENRNMEEFLRLVADTRVHLEPLITHQFALEEAPRAYATILDPHSDSLAVLLRYPGAAPPTAVFEPKRRVQIAAGGGRDARLGVALVGAGNLARWTHLPNLRRTPGVALRAICSSSPVRAKSYAARFGAASCCSDYGEILDDPAVHVVLIASRNGDHASQALEALRAGKHVFVEKPMALTEEECRLLRRAVEETGQHLTVGFNRRFAPFYLEMKRHLAGRVAPAVVNVRVSSPAISGSYWMADSAAGGAILGDACHFVDLMYWLLQSEPVDVSAYSLPLDRKDPIGHNNLAASFRFADGSIGNLTYTTMGGKSSGGERVEAFAPGVSVGVEDFKRLLVASRRRRHRSHWWPQKGHRELLASFLEGIREGRPPQVTVHDGSRATIGCLRMLESARASEPRRIESLA